MYTEKKAFWGILLAGIACVGIAMYFVINALSVQTPADILTSLDASDVEWAQVSVYTPDSCHKMLTETQTDTLVSILNSIDSHEYQRKNPGHDTSIFLYCGDKEILLTYDNSYVGFSFDSAAAASLDDTSWAVQNETLNRFLDALVEEMETENCAD